VCRAKGDFLSNFHYISTRVDQAKLELVAGIAYKVWLQRNRHIFGGQFLSPICLVERAREELHEYQLAGLLVSPIQQNLENIQSNWVKPPPRWIKLNWDAATDSKKKSNGGGSHWPRFWGNGEGSFVQLYALSY